MQKQWKRAVGLAAAIAAVATCGVAHADWAGKGMWIPGQTAAFSGMQANSGWTVNLQPYYYNGNAKKTEGMPWENQLTKEYETHTSEMLFGVNFAFKDFIAGGRVSLGLNWGGGSTNSGIGLFDSNGASYTTSSSSSGMSDIQPYTNIAWRDGDHNFMLYITGNLPVTDYDRFRAANISLGYNAADFGGAYTYLDRKTGMEFSVITGATWNDKIKNTQYQNGWDGHLDMSVSKFISPQWSIGAVGYGYWQYTEDEYNGKGNGVKSQVFALGPQATYVFKVAQREWTVNFRGYWEFAAQNRPEGYALFATLSMPLGGN